MRKDLNYLNSICRMYDINFVETEFMNQTKDKFTTYNAIPAIFEIPNPPHASTQIKEEGINR